MNEQMSVTLRCDCAKVKITVVFGQVKQAAGWGSVRSWPREITIQCPLCKKVLSTDLDIKLAQPNADSVGPGFGGTRPKTSRTGLGWS